MTKHISVSFHVKEFGDKPKWIHSIEVEPAGTFPFSGAMFLELKNNSSMEEAQTIAKFLRDNITEITFVTRP